MPLIKAMCICIRAYVRARIPSPKTIRLNHQRNFYSFLVQLIVPVDFYALLFSPLAAH